MEASAPTHPRIEPEPPEWQPRALWVGARLLCGAVSVFFISFVFAFFCAYWIETQGAGLWRLRRGEWRREVAEGVPAPDTAVADAGMRACAFFWAFYVGIGVVAFIILYLVT